MSDDNYKQPLMTMQTWHDIGKEIVSNDPFSRRGFSVVPNNSGGFKGGHSFYLLHASYNHVKILHKNAIFLLKFFYRGDTALPDPALYLCAPLPHSKILHPPLPTCNRRLAEKLCFGDATNWLFNWYFQRWMVIC